MIRFGDVDGDGDLDAFVTNMLGEGNIVVLNDGTGTFANSGQSIGTGNGQAVALGDVDGDGDLDAFVANGNFSSPESNHVYPNDGAGTFTDSGQSLGTGNSQDVALGDLDGDGDLDAVVANTRSSTSGAGEPNRVYVNAGDCTFLDTGQLLGGDNSQGIALADVDGDGELAVDRAHVLANDNDVDGDPLTITEVDGQAIADGGPAVTLASGATVAATTRASRPTARRWRSSATPTTWSMARPTNSPADLGADTAVSDARHRSLWQDRWSVLPCGRSRHHGGNDRKPHRTGILQVLRQPLPNLLTSGGHGHVLSSNSLGTFPRPERSPATGGRAWRRAHTGRDTSNSRL